MSEPRDARTGDVAMASAVGRAVHVLAALLLALDEGSHQLSIVAERTNDTTVTADLSLSVEAAPLRVTHCAEEYLRFLALLAFALDYSSVRHAVLVATTVDKPSPRAAGPYAPDGCTPWTPARSRRRSFPPRRPRSAAPGLPRARPAPPRRAHRGERP